MVGSFLAAAPHATQRRSVRKAPVRRRRAAVQRTGSTGRPADAAAGPVLALVEAGVAQLLGSRDARRRLLPAGDAPFVDACAQTSGGNPFFLHELLKAAREARLNGDVDDADRVRGLVPESVRCSVSLRLGALTPPARRLASALAVLGDRTPLRRAAALAEMDGETGEVAADALAAARLVVAGEPLSFTDPLIGAAVRAELPAQGRSRAHRRAAALLEQEQAPVEAIAAHLVACRPDHDDHVVSVLQLAASRATKRGEHDAAQRFLRRALDEPAARAVRAELLVDLALAETAMGAPTALQSTKEALELLPDGPRGASVGRR